MDSGLKFRVRVQVEAVQVVIVGVQAEVASRDTVWVEQRDDLEDILLEEQTGLLSAILKLQLRLGVITLRGESQGCR